MIDGPMTSSSVGGGLVASMPFRTSLNIPSPPTATMLKMKYDEIKVGTILN